MGAPDEEEEDESLRRAGGGGAVEELQQEERESRCCNETEMNERLRLVSVLESVKPSCRSERDGCGSTWGEAETSPSLPLHPSHPPPLRPPASACCDSKGHPS